MIQNITKPKFLELDFISFSRFFFLLKMIELNHLLIHYDLMKIKSFNDYVFQAAAKLVATELRTRFKRFIYRIKSVSSLFL